MPVRVKCRCGQEFVVRYRELTHFLVGLLVLCLVVNTLVVVLIYLRLEHPPPPEGAAKALATAPSPPAGANERPAEAERVADPAAPAGPVTRQDQQKPPPAASAPPDAGAGGEPAGDEPGGDEPERREGPGGTEGAGDEANEPRRAAAPRPEADRRLALAPASSASLEESLLAEVTALPRKAEVDAAKRGSAPASEGSAVAGAGGAPRLVLEADALVRLAALERHAEATSMAFGFLLDPDPRLRRRALHLARRAPVPEDAAGAEARDRAASGIPPHLLALAAPLFKADGLERRLFDLWRERFPGSPPAEHPVPPPEPPASSWESVWSSWSAAAAAVPEAEALRERLRGVESGGVDVVLLIDTTQSMEGALKEIVAGAEWLLPALDWAVPGIHIALLLYRDEVVLVEDLAPDAARLLPALRQAKGEGGGDVPEGVHTALKAALSLGRVHWRQASEKHIVLIGDAPPPFASGRRLVGLAKEAHRQGGFHLHAMSINPGEGRTAVPFFAELAGAGGGCASSPSPDALAEEVLGCLLRGGAPDGARLLAARDLVLPALRALFAPAG